MGRRPVYAIRTMCDCVGCWSCDEGVDDSEDDEVKHGLVRRPYILFANSPCSTGCWLMPCIEASVHFSALRIISPCPWQESTHFRNRQKMRLNKPQRNGPNISSLGEIVGLSLAHPGFTSHGECGFSRWEWKLGEFLGGLRLPLEL